ncbi:hypothetical protein CLV63_102200 [Murinocardiopsis flavida]|uniref:Uncharacterized protein n=1 Tax=Murinocardiopsis flavida TaxID=645275 RepID=A0A2P8DS76_9ACTN|nr:hypothetical protein CLV63_102200 [Murinocardiopsis flavida]
MSASDAIAAGAGSATSEPPESWFSVREPGERSAVRYRPWCQSQFLRLKITKRTTLTRNIRPTAIGKPYVQWVSGITSKFMP